MSTSTHKFDTYVIYRIQENAYCFIDAPTYLSAVYEHLYHVSFSHISAELYACQTYV